MSARTFRELRAWQAVRAFKLGVYGLVEREPIAHDVKLCGQLREAAASAQSHISEGFGRFDPLDFARFLKMSRASLLECANHLSDAVDRRHVTDDSLREDHARLEQAMKEVGGLLDYLQSPEARRNAERLRQRRIERRHQRRNGNSEP